MFDLESATNNTPAVPASGLQGIFIFTFIFKKADTQSTILWDDHFLASYVKQ